MAVISVDDFESRKSKGQIQFIRIGPGRYRYIATVFDPATGKPLPEPQQLLLSIDNIKAERDKAVAALNKEIADLDVLINELETREAAAQE